MTACPGVLSAARCSRSIQAGDARRCSAPRAADAQVREWYQAVADGQITDDPIIGPEWAREWLRWQDGEVDDPLVAVLGMPTAGS